MRSHHGRVAQRWGSHGAITVAVMAIVLLGGAGWAELASPQHQVSQKNQAFTPGEIAVKRGETVRIVNDDGELLHHSYVESKTFSFDSGDQGPGTNVDITFPVHG